MCRRTLRNLAGFHAATHPASDKRRKRLREPPPYSMRTMRSETRGKRANTAGSWPGTRKRALRRSIASYPAVRRFEAASSVCEIAVCVPRSRISTCCPTRGRPCAQAVLHGDELRRPRVLAAHAKRDAGQRRVVVAAHERDLACVFRFTISSTSSASMPPWVVRDCQASPV